MADRRSSPRRRDPRRSEYAEPSARTYIEPRAGNYQNPGVRPTSYDAEPPQPMRGPDNEVYFSSSSSSSYIDISRTYPSRGSRIRAFFFAPSERRKVRKRRSRRGLFRFGNNSSSSIVNEDLAYGTGFIKLPKRRGVRSRDGRERVDGGRYSDREGKTGRRRSGTNISRTNLSDGGRYSDREGGRGSRSKINLNEGEKYSDREGGRASRSNFSDGGRRSDRESGRVSRTNTKANEGGRYNDREGGRMSRSRTNLNSAVTDAEILAVGAGLAKLAREQNRADLRAARSGSGRGSELFAVRGNTRNQGSTSRGLGPSKISHGSDTLDDDGWESASDDESESSVDSRLAYGNDSKSTWNFFGRKKYKPLSRKDSVVDPKLFGPQNSLNGILAKPVGFDDVSPWTSSSDFGQRPGFDLPVASTPVPPTPVPAPSFTSSQASLKQVFPMPTSDPTRFDAGRGSMVSEPRYDPSRNSMPPGPEYGRGSMVSESRYNSSRNSMPPGPEPLISSRPGPIPLQQPQPITPVSQKVYEPVYKPERSSTIDSPSRQTPSSSGRSKSLAEAALAGVASTTVVTAIASSRDDRKDRRREEAREEEDRLRRREADKRARDEEDRLRRREAERKQREEEDRLRRREAEKKEREDEDRRRREAEKKEREDRRRAEELAELEKERLRREKKDKEDRERERDDHRDKGRDKDRIRDDDGSRQEKKREKRRDETREEREARREKRRAERSDRSGVSKPDTRTELSQSDRPDARRAVSEAAVPQIAVDPFQYQVNDDEFSTPTAEDPLGHRKQQAVPTVVTVERVPGWMRNESSTRDEPSSSYSRDTHGDRALHEGEALYEDIKHSTIPFDTAIIGAADAAVMAEEYRQRSERRRDERRRADRDYEDYESRDKKPKERDPIQEEADRAYREIVMARKIASQVIRSRSASPDRSIMEKYDGKEQDVEEPVRIVTPPAMETQKQKGLYDAPNADFSLDYILEHPRELHNFYIPAIDFDNSFPDTLIKKDPDAERPRPFLNLVRPTPVPSPAPERQESRPRSSRSEDSSEPQRYQSTDDVVIGPKGDIVASPTTSRPASPTPSTVSKGVSWGENETKHYEVETPFDQRDEFVTKSDATPRNAPSEIEAKPAESSKKARGWGAIAAGIIGGGVVAANSGETSKPSQSQEIEKQSEGSYEYRGVVVEPEEEPPKPQRRRSPPSARLVEEPASPPLRPRRESPPLTGPEPTTSQSTHMPGAFDDDLDFTAHVAAGLHDTGFDPNIVIDDPSFRRRDSPPGSNGPMPYHAPYAETVTDLGSIRGDIPETQPRGFVEGEVANTPSDWQSVSPKREPGPGPEPEPEPEPTPTKLSKKEQKKRERAKRRGEDVAANSASSTSRDVAQEPESYFEPKLSKKEQKERERASKSTNIIEDVTEAPEPSIATAIVEEPESYIIETPKKSKKKSKRSSTVDYIVEELPRELPRESRAVSVSVDAFDDIQNGEDEWTSTVKSKKKSKRDSERYDSPSRSALASEVGTELSRSSSKKSRRDSERYDSPSRSAPASDLSTEDWERSAPASEVGTELSRLSSKKSKDKSRKRSEQYETDPAEISLPPSNPSEISRDADYDDTRKSRKSSARDSGVLTNADHDDSRSVVSAGTSRYDDDTPKRKKKSRSSGKDDYDDTRSVASAPAGDDYDDKKSKKKDKEKRSSGLWGLFGSKSDSKSDVSTRDESPKRYKDDTEDKKRSKKSKRSSVPDVSGVYGDIGATSVSDLSRSVSNGHGTKHHYEDYEDGTRSDGEPSEKKRKSKSRSQSVSSKKDSFLDNAGTLGAGVGIASVAAATIIAQEHSQSQAANADSSKTLQESPERELSRPNPFDYEVTERQFRPSIDPQYGDLLQLPPSDPSTPEIDPLDELPELPDSRPETPEMDRLMRERSVSSVRKSLQDTPMKSPSQSTVPLALRFASANRSNPSSPAPFRSSPLQSPATPNIDTLSLAARSRSRPTSWDGKEFRPLFLVESNRRNSTHLDEKHEDLPALPESQRTSRSSSQIDFDRAEDWERDAKSTVPDPLSIDTALASAASPDLLDSQQSTPKAGEMSYSIDAVVEPGDVAKPESPIEESKPHALQDVALAIAAGVVDESVLHYMDSDDGLLENTRDISEQLPSIPRQPSPVNPVTKDRSSYLLKSSPISKNSDDGEDRDREVESPTKKRKDTLQSIKEGESSDTFAIPDDIRAEREKALETLSGFSPEASNTSEIQGNKELSEIVSKKSKKDKKKGKKGRSPPAWEIETEDSDDKIQTENETLPDVPAWVAIQQAEESIPGSSQDPIKNLSPFDSEQADESSSSKSKKDKKNKKKGKSISPWQGEKEQVEVPVVTEESPKEITRDLSDDVIGEKDQQDDESSLPKSKKDRKKSKKKGRSVASWEDEGDATSSSVPTEEPAEAPTEDTRKMIVEQPEIIVAPDDESSLSKTKKDKRKDKKSRSSSYYEPEETVDSRRLTARNSADEQPTPSEATSEDYLFTKSKKDKKKKRKSVTFSEPGDDDQFSDLPKEPWFETGELPEPVSILKESSWIDRDLELSPTEEPHSDPVESSPKQKAVETSRDLKNTPISEHADLQMEPMVSKEDTKPISIPEDDKVELESDTKTHEVEPISVAHVDSLPRHPELAESDKAIIPESKKPEVAEEPTILLTTEDQLPLEQETQGRGEVAEHMVETYEKGDALSTPLPALEKDEKTIVGAIEEPQCEILEDTTRADSIAGQTPVGEQSTPDELILTPGKKAKKKKKGKSASISESESFSSVPEPVVKDVAQDSQAESSQATTNDELVVGQSRKGKKKKKDKSFSASEPEEDKSIITTEPQFSEEPVIIAADKDEDVRKESQKLAYHDPTLETQDISTDGSVSRDLSTPSSVADMHEKLAAEPSEESIIHKLNEAENLEHVEEAAVPVEETKVVEPETTVPEQSEPFKQPLPADETHQEPPTTAEEKVSTGTETKGFLARTLFPAAAAGAALFGFGSSKKDDAEDAKSVKDKEVKLVKDEEIKSIEVESAKSIEAESKSIEAGEPKSVEVEELDSVNIKGSKSIQVEESKPIEENQSARLSNDTEPTVPISETMTEADKINFEPTIPQIEKPAPASEELPSSLPDGLNAGYNDDQVSLARQLREELGRKPSKRDKKKRQSLPSTPEPEPSRSRTVDDLAEGHPRARSLSIGPFAARFGVSPGSGDRKSVYSEEQLEIARQLKEEFGSGSKKSSEKDRKNRSSRSATRDASPFGENVESREAVSAEQLENTPRDSPLATPARDGLEAGYQEDQLSFARQLQTEFRKKSSKKDKKRKSTSQTPQEQEPRNDYFDEASQSITAEPLPIEESSAVPEQVPQPATPRDGLAVGYNEDQVELARQLREQFGSGSKGKKDKKDKKDKKRQSLFRSTTDDGFSSDPYSRDADESNVQTPQTEAAESTWEAAPTVVTEDKFASTSKKSKRDKKGKKRENILQSNNEDDFSSDAPPKDDLNTAEDVTQVNEPIADPEADFAPITKKTKKDKKDKKRESILRESADDDFSSDTVAKEQEATGSVPAQTPAETKSEVLEKLATPEEEFSLPGKKNKNDKKKRLSLLARETLVPSRADESPTLDATMVGATPETPSQDIDVSEFSTKESKKDKKKRKSQSQSSAVEETSVSQAEPKDLIAESISQDIETEKANVLEAPLAEERQDQLESLDKNLTTTTDVLPSFSTEPTLVQEPITEPEPEPDLPTIETEKAVPESSTPELEADPSTSVSDPVIEVTIDNPEEQFNEFTFTKKSKRDKKKRKNSSKNDSEDASGYSTPLGPVSGGKDITEEPSTAILSSEQLVETVPEQTEPQVDDETKDNEWAVPGKKSKKDKKKKRDSLRTSSAGPSGTSTPLEIVPQPVGDPSSSVVLPEEIVSEQPQATPPETEPNLPMISAPTEVSEVPVDDGNYIPSKKSKKDRKKKRDSLTTSSAGPSGTSTPLEPIEEPEKTLAENPLPPELTDKKDESVETIQEAPKEVSEESRDLASEQPVEVSHDSHEDALPESHTFTPAESIEPVEEAVIEPIQESHSSTHEESVDSVESVKQPVEESFQEAHPMTVTEYMKSAQEPREEPIQELHSSIIEESLNSAQEHPEEPPHKTHSSGSDEVMVSAPESIEDFTRKPHILATEDVADPVPEILEEPAGHSYSLASEESGSPVNEPLEESADHARGLALEESIAHAHEPVNEPAEPSHTLVSEGRVIAVPEPLEEVAVQPHELASIKPESSVQDPIADAPQESHSSIHGEPAIPNPEPIEEPFKEPRRRAPLVVAGTGVAAMIAAIESAKNPSQEVSNTEPESDWSASTKKSKKDKKQKSGLSTPAEVGLPTSSEPVVESSNQPQEQQASTDTMTKEVDEEPVEEQHWSGKKSKKDKKRQKSGASTSASEAISSTSETPLFTTELEQEPTDIAAKEASEEPAEAWSLPGKKSKRDKKKQKSGASTPANEPTASISESPLSMTEQEQIPTDTIVKEVSKEPVEEWSNPSKKSKKDKKRQKSGASTPGAEPTVAASTSETNPTEPVEQTEKQEPDETATSGREAVQDILQELVDEGALPGKKSKKDKKKRKSGVSTPAEEVEPQGVEQSLSENSRSIEKPEVVEQTSDSLHQIEGEVQPPLEEAKPIENTETTEEKSIAFHSSGEEAQTPLEEAKLIKDTETAEDKSIPFHSSEEEAQPLLAEAKPVENMDFSEPAPVPVHLTLGEAQPLPEIPNSIEEEYIEQAPTSLRQTTEEAELLPEPKSILHVDSVDPAPVSLQVVEQVQPLELERSPTENSKALEVMSPAESAPLIAESSQEVSDEWSLPSKKSKKDKKDKKKKSRVSTPVDVPPIIESENPTIASSSRDESVLDEEPSQQSESELKVDEWALPGKKSKKDKKNRKSGQSTPAETVPITEPEQDTLSTKQPLERTVEDMVHIVAGEPAGEKDGEWAVPSKKPKKDKKSRMSDISTPVEEVSSIEPGEAGMQSLERVVDPIINEDSAEAQDSELSLPGKKSKKDKKKLKSGISTPIEEIPGVESSQVAEKSLRKDIKEIYSINSDMQEAIEEQKEDDSLLGKKSNKDKKKRKSGILTPIKQTPILESEPASGQLFEEDAREIISVIPEAPIDVPIQEEESSLPGKQSKMDKKKRKSIASIGAEETPTIETSAAELEKPFEQSVEENIEEKGHFLAEETAEVQDEESSLPTEKSKKDKKRKSGASTPAEEIHVVEPDQAISIPELSTAGHPEEAESVSAVVPTEQIDEDWARPEKKSKKDKKRKSGFSPPIEEAPTFEVEQNITHPNQSATGEIEEAPSTSTDAVVEQQEEGLALPEKKSKKDKKRKSGLSTPVEETPALEQEQVTLIPEGSGDIKDLRSIPVDPPTDREEQWALPGKKSKKDKKNRKSGLTTPEEENIISEPKPEQSSAESTHLSPVEILEPSAIEFKSHVLQGVPSEPIASNLITRETSDLVEDFTNQELQSSSEDIIKEPSNQATKAPIEILKEQPSQPKENAVSKEIMEEPRFEPLNTSVSGETMEQPSSEAVDMPVSRVTMEELATQLEKASTSKEITEEPMRELVDKGTSKEIVEESKSESTENLVSREVVNEPINKAANNSVSRDIVEEPVTQTVKKSLYEEVIEPRNQAAEEWGSFATKKSKKDKKKRKSGISTPLEDMTTSQPKEAIATESGTTFEPSVTTKANTESPQEVQVADTSPQELTESASINPIDDDLANQSREIIEPPASQQEPAEGLLGIVRKKSKKDKKSKKAVSRVGSESGPSTSVPTRVPTPEVKSAELPSEASPILETGRIVTSPVPFEEPSRSFDVDSAIPVAERDVGLRDEAQDVPGGLSRKPSKKEKRKRQSTVDIKVTENQGSSTAPVTSWADEIEEAEVVREIPVIEDIAKDDSLSHIASATPASAIDDFIRPTKKGKKGIKKKTSVETTSASDSFLEPGSDSLQVISEEERSIIPNLVAAGTVAASGAALLSKAEEPSKQTSSKPARKLTKEKRKQSIDKRSLTKDDIFDDPALWEGEKPRVHEEEKGLEDDAGSDGFWSPPQEEVPSIHETIQDARLKTPLPEIEREAPLGHSTTVIETSRDLPIEASAPDSHSTLISKTSRGLLIGSNSPIASEPKESFEHSHPPTTPIPSRTPELLRNKDIDSEDTPPILQRYISPPPHGFSDPISIDRSISPQERRAEHSKSPFRSSRFSQIGFSDLPVVDEEENPEPQHHHSTPHVNVDVNRDSAFVGGSPIPPQSGFADNQSHVRDSGVHLRDSSPATGTHGPVSSSDAAIARLSWPPVDEESETVDLHRSQTPHRDVSTSSIHHEDKRELKQTHDATSLSRSDKSNEVNRGRKVSSPRYEETTASRDLSSQKSYEDKETDLHKIPIIQGETKEVGIVKQRLQQFQSPEESLVKQRVQRSQPSDTPRSQKPKEDKYAELASLRPKAEKPKGISDLEAGAVIAGAALGFSSGRRISAESRPSSAQSQRSLSNINRMRTPDIKRPESSASNRSGTPPLRRTDRQRSGDLRSLSQQSKPDLAKEAELAAAASTPSLANTANPQANEGRVRAKDMADVYDGFGEGRMGSPRSPTRPHSMRRRQSMQVLDLENKVEQLVAENRRLAEEKAQAEHVAQLGTHASSSLVDKDAEIDSLKRTLDWLHKEVSRLTEVNEGLTSANATIARQHSDRYSVLETQHTQATRELQEVRDAHTNLSAGMEGVVRNQVQTAVAEKDRELAERDREIAELRAELDAAKEKIREMQRQILLSKANDTEFLTVRDEDYFDNACQQLCQHVQQWVLRFSKFSDMRACRLTKEINNDKTIDRLDNAVLDGSDVDIYLSDRVKRRDVFMSMTMTMVWEFIFTRYLFGMDREQRQKLKSLEKTLLEVGPAAAVHTWRATTLTLLAKRPAFAKQREQDTQAVVHAIIETLSEILPPPSHLEGQIEDQLTRVMKSAVDLSIEMRCQRAEYMMLPPLQPEYDANGDLASKVTFNAALMNERSGDTVSNEDLEAQKAVVRIVLFPLVVKKGDDSGEGDEEIVVCPAQVLVAKAKKVRMAEQDNRSKVSMQSSFPMSDTDNVI